MPEDLSSKSGLTRTATRAGRPQLRGDTRASTSISRTDSTLTQDAGARPPARARASLLPGPGEADLARRHAGIERDPQLARRRRRRARRRCRAMWRDERRHRIRLHRVVQLDRRPAGAAGAARRARRALRGRTRRTACAPTCSASRVSGIPPTCRQSSATANCVIGACCGSGTLIAEPARTAAGTRPPAPCGRSCRSGCAAAARPRTSMLRRHHVGRQALAALRRAALAASSAAPGFGVATTHDRLAEHRVRHAERRALRPTSCVRVEHLLDLGRADAIARGLDHLVAPADEVEKALVVPAHGVAREHRDLGQHEARLRGPAAACSARRSSPDRSSSPCRPARRDARARPARSARTRVPSSRSTRISAFGIALPIESGRRSTSSGGR